MTREEWLNAALSELREHVFTANGVVWKPDLKIRVSCGWPPSKALSTKRRTIGFCHTREQSKDQTSEVFVSPFIDDSLEVLATEAHEIIHAIDNCKSHHKGFFLKTMKEIGLEGKPTATHASSDMIVRLNGIIGRIGTYPHSTLNPASRDKKQTTRMVKAECPECGYVIRTTRKWIDEAGLPVCPCGARFVQNGSKDPDPEPEPEPVFEPESPLPNGPVQGPRKPETENLGIAYVNDQKRYFISSREITRGKNKGMIEVTLTNRKNVAVDRSSITREVEKDENIPCKKCGRIDLPLHENYLCPECWPEN